MDPFEAVTQGDADALRATLAADHQLAGTADDRGISLVRWALYRGRRDLADIVLELDPPLDVWDVAALGDVDRLRGVIEQEPTLTHAHSRDGFTPLHFAAFLGTPECVEALLADGADPSEPTTGDQRIHPLNSAAAARQLRSAELLLDHGAEIDQAQTGGFTALHSAAHNGDAALVQLLLDRGADRGLTTDDGLTPADVARAAGHPDLADELDPVSR